MKRCRRPDNRQQGAGLALSVEMPVGEEIQQPVNPAAAGGVEQQREVQGTLSSSRTVPHRIECPDCGLFQILPALSARDVARCARCDGVLRRARRDPIGPALALNIASIALLIISCIMTLMTVSTAGIRLSADLFTGPDELKVYGVWELSVVVLFTTIGAPLGKLVLTTYVLSIIRFSRAPGHIRSAFIWAERLRPWSMIEVYLLGVFVAYVKLADIVTIDVGVALYTLVALLFAMVAADFMLDRHAVWETIDTLRSQPVPVETIPITDKPTDHQLVGCDVCSRVNAVRIGTIGLCVRCGSELEHRKRNSLNRTWALTAAAAILYIPANIYPVLTVKQLGAGAPSTILGGAQELLQAGMWPLAALVFFASIAVPCLKLAGLTLLLFSIHRRSAARLTDRTVLYRLISTIGRWSMIDIFMESILVALVQFGTVVVIEPGYGAVAFAAVVILTMFGAEAFDPRIMWDAAAPSDLRSTPADRANPTPLPRSFIEKLRST
jgi:paraquat-inducible protein A